MKEVGSKPFSFGRLLLYLILAMFTLSTVLPFYWLFVGSTNTTADISRFPPPLLPGSHFIENMQNVFANVDFIRALMNSIFVSTVITISVLFFCSLAGFAFAKLQFKGKNYLFIFVLATMMVPIQLGLIPQYMIISKLGWINSLNAIIVPAMVNAFGVFWMRQYIESAIPDELIAAARIDGCSIFRTYRSIVLPVVKPGLATLGIVTFMTVWNDYLWPLVVLKDDSVHTIQLALRILNGDAYGSDYGMVLNGTFLATLPLLIVFFIFSKQIIAGLTEGAVKH